LHLFAGIQPGSRLHINLQGAFGSLRLSAGGKCEHDTARRQKDGVTHEILRFQTELTLMGESLTNRIQRAVILRQASGLNGGGRFDFLSIFLFFNRAPLPCFRRSTMVFLKPEKRTIQKPATFVARRF
jgi:hypothetical protein